MIIYPDHTVLLYYPVV